MIAVKSLASSSKGNAYIISDSESSVLLECGIPWKQIQKGTSYQTSSLSGCLVTHLHGDHSVSIKDAVYHGVDVYASKETFDHHGVNSNRAKKILSGDTFTIGTWDIRAFKTEHDCEGSLGFLMRNNLKEYCLFLTDSKYTKHLFPPLHTIIIEANFSLEIVNENIKSGRIDHARKKRLIETHLSIERVIDLLKANDLSQCKAIHLIHLSSDNSDEALFKRMVQEETGIPVTVEAE